jgi:hypothetical protein
LPDAPNEAGLDDIMRARQSCHFRAPGHASGTARYQMYQATICAPSKWCILHHFEPFFVAYPT